MKEKFAAAIEWLKSNKIAAVGLALVALIFVYKRFAKKTYKRRRRALPRSVNYPVRRKRAGSTARRRTSRSGKPAWMIKGSPAARRRMALLRRKRNKKLF